ncbi:MAG: co-chaperone GroES family protein [Gemmatimonadota bacterium]|nr:co-chaperone GroES family protein [Gemmatimonadota bacterium]
MGREVILIADKVLIKEEESTQTPSGLLLPQGIAEKEKVASGYVVNTGPGYPTSEPAGDGEPWSRAGARNEIRYVPLQAANGDFAVFLRREAIEVEIDGGKYMIVPHGAILLLIRDRMTLGS